MIARSILVNRLRRDGNPTIPSLMSDETATNPFLRADDVGLAASLGLTGALPSAVFAKLRAAKDQFR